MKPSDFSRRRQKISELFDILFDAIEIINSNFTIHLIFVLINITTTNVFGAFSIAREFLTNYKMFSFQLVNNLFWILVQYLLKVLMAQAGSRTESEVDCASVIVLKATGSLETDNPLQKDLDIFLKQLKSRNKKLRALFFTINWKLIANVRKIFFENFTKI